MMDRYQNEKKQQTNKKGSCSNTWVQYLCAAGTTLCTPVLEPHDWLWLPLHSPHGKLGPLIFSCKTSPYCLVPLLAKLSPVSVSWRTCLFTHSSHASFGKSRLSCTSQGWVTALLLKAGWLPLLRSSHSRVKFLPSLSIVIILFLASLPQNGSKQQQSLFHVSNHRPLPKIGSRRRSALFFHSSPKDAFLNDTVVSKAIEKTLRPPTSSLLSRYCVQGAALESVGQTLTLLGGKQGA